MRSTANINSVFVNEYITHRNRDLIFLEYMDRVKRDTKYFPKPESEIIDLLYKHYLLSF